MEQEEKQFTDEELKLFYDGRSKDWHLQNLISIVNKLDIQVGITLHLEGILVSGQLISAKAYFKKFADDFAYSYPGSQETKDSIRDSFASLAQMHDEPETETETEPVSTQEKNAALNYIHLMDCRTFTPGNQPIPTNGGVLWRGRINAVSGFSLGQLRAD